MDEQKVSRPSHLLLSQDCKLSVCRKKVIWIRNHDGSDDEGFWNLNPKNICNLWSLITSMSVHQLSYHLMNVMMTTLMITNMMMMMMKSHLQQASIQLAPSGDDDGYLDKSDKLNLISLTVRHV